MGRFKADRYWYVPLVVALGLLIAGAIQLLRSPPIPAFQDGWFERDEARMRGWELIGFGGFVLVISIQLWIKKSKRLKIPDEVRQFQKLQQLERLYAAGTITQDQYWKKRAKLVPPS